LLSAVKNVSFTVPQSGSLAIVGESGSGKTTTARIIVGLDTPTSGEVRFGGNVLQPHPGRNDRRARARLIQMVFQNPYSSLDAHQSIAAAIGEVIAFHEVRPIQGRADRVAELFQQVGLDARLGSRLPRELSGGQCQRAAIARALAAEPELVVLDEAVSALDVSTQAQILNLLSDLRDQLGIAVLMISHDLAVVRQVADYVAVMYRGEIVESGDVDSVLSSPTHSYTRRLLASVPSFIAREKAG
jgi:ABC-type glutathione transport system ATPase component